MTHYTCSFLIDIVVSREIEGISSEFRQKPNVSVRVSCLVLRPCPTSTAPPSTAPPCNEYPYIYICQAMDNGAALRVKNTFIDVSGTLARSRPECLHRKTDSIHHQPEGVVNRSFVPILAQSQSQKSLPGGGGV